MTIQGILKDFPKKEQQKWIRGHPDDTRPYDELSWIVKMNVHTNNQATRASQEVMKRRQPPKMIRLPACPIYLLAQGREQTSHELATLRSDMARDRMEEYLKERNEWSKKALFVAWVPYEQVMNNLTETERVFVVIFSNRWLATSTRQKREGAESDQCILCNDQEDFYHIY
jgi:hypothetical protein